MTTHQRWTLARRPQGLPTKDDFKLEQSPLPEPKDGQALVRVDYISVDPGMRSRLSGDSYAPAMQIGTTIESAGIGTVIASRNPKFAEGTKVWGGFGWQSHILAERGMQALDPAIYNGPVHETAAIGVLGIPGLTAFFGLGDLGKPKEGETVVVSAAAGSVGSIVGQIAKIKGCRVVGIAGGKDKCDWLTSELGFDAAVDYKDGGTFKALRAAAPKGIDVYFDNVGGDILEACIAQMNNRGRIACCGAISQYDGVPSAHGPRGVPGLLVGERLTMQGFIVMDYAEHNAQALADLQSWVKSGQLKVQEDIISGLENTPAALIGLLAGENRGKRMVRV